MSPLRCLFALILFLSFSNCFGQPDSSHSTSKDTVISFKKGNHIYSELGFRTEVLGSIGYEYIYSEKGRIKYSIQGGVSAIGFKKRENFVWSIYLAHGFFYGKHKHHIELSPSITFTSGWTHRDIGVANQSSVKAYALVFSTFLGYRFQCPTHGIAFRIGYLPQFTTLGSAFENGIALSLGYNFKCKRKE